RLLQPMLDETRPGRSRYSDAGLSPNCWVVPWSAVFAAETFGSVGIIHDHAFVGVIDDGVSDFHSDVGKDAACGGEVAFFDVGDGAAALVNRGQKIEQMAAGGGRGV